MKFFIILVFLAGVLLLFCDLSLSDPSQESEEKLVDTLYISNFKNVNKYSKKFIEHVQAIIACDTSMTDLDGVQYFINVTYLKISSQHHLSDVSPVQYLSKLLYLDASYLKVTDFSPVGNCNLLVKLKAPGNDSLQNLDFLKKLKHLKYLDISNVNKNANFSVISTLENLNYLDISGNKLTDLNVIKNLKNLKFVDLTYCPIRDFSDIASLKGLEVLQIKSDIYGSQGYDAVFSLEYLKGIGIDGSQYNGIVTISDFATIRSQKSICFMELRKITYPSGLKNIGNFCNLEYFLLANSNCSSELTDLKRCTNLIELRIFDNDSLINLEFLSAFKHIPEKFAVEYCKNLKDISALSMVKGIKILDLDQNDSIKDYSPLLSLWVKGDSAYLSGVPDSIYVQLKERGVNVSKIPFWSKLPSDLKCYQQCYSGVDMYSGLGPY
jgi:internalin A